MGSLHLKWIVGWVVGLLLVGCGAPASGLEVPARSQDLKGQSYQAVITTFRDAGFTNVETEVTDDLITGWLVKDGSVERVAINGSTSFAVGDRFPADARIVVTYHTFPARAAPGSEATGTPASAAPPTTVQATPSMTPGAPQASSAEPVTPTPTTAPDLILTAENNDDMAAVLASHRMNDLGAHLAFADQYRGRIIRFDGTVAFVMPHGNAKTRFDYLIYQGDFDDPQPTSGPSFAFIDVNYGDFKLVGRNAPDTLGVGTNLTVTAKIKGFNAEGGYIELVPVATVVR